MLPVLLIASALIFTLGHLAPGDPVLILLEMDATPEVIKEVRERYGLDKPLPIQYFFWLKNALMGDLGFSYFHPKMMVTDLIAEHFSVTARIALLAIIIAIIAGVGLGVIAAWTVSDVINYYTKFYEKKIEKAQTILRILQDALSKLDAIKTDDQL